MAVILAQAFELASVCPQFSRWSDRQYFLQAGIIRILYLT